MKILIDLTSIHSHLTGVERFAMNISKALMENHPEEEYILLFREEIHGEFEKIIGSGRGRAVVLHGNNPLYFNQVTLPSALRKNPADRYFFPAFPPPWMFGKKGIVTTIHDISDFDCPQGKNRLKVLYCRLGILHAKHRSDKIVTVSEFSKKRIIERLRADPEKIHVVYNGISSVFQSEIHFSHCEEVRSRYRLPEDYLLCVSTLEPRKNIRLLLEAYGELHQAGKITEHLVLVGRKGWNMKEVFGESSDAGDYVHVTGFMEDEDLPYVYRMAKLFVFPSKYEGFGIPPLESMSQGTPVLSSDAASMPEVLGDAAAYFRSENKDNLRDQLLNVLSAPSVSEEKLKEQAAKYSWEKEAEKLWTALM